MTRSSWQGRLMLWGLYGLGIPVSPILLAVVFDSQQGGHPTASSLLGKGELDLAAVGVYASVIALMASGGVRGEFEQIMLGVAVVLILFTGASFANVVTAISTKGTVDPNSVVFFSFAWLFGAIVLGVFAATASQPQATNT